MARDRAYAHRNDYYCYCFHLLCAAAQWLQEYTALGYDCYIFAETYSHMSKTVEVKQTVYYTAHKRINQPTRKERGANLGRTAHA